MCASLGLTDRFRFTADFLVALVVLSIPSLWLSRPWDWDLPAYSILSGLIFIPLATTIVVYCPIMFIRAILKSGRTGMKIAKAFIGVVIAAGMMLLLSSVFGGFKPVDTWLVVLVASWATVALDDKIKRAKSEEELNESEK